MLDLLPPEIVGEISKCLSPQAIANLRQTAKKHANNEYIINHLLSLAVCPEIVAGRAHSLALAADGSVYAWGNNFQGQLGLGHVGVQNTPQRITAFDGKQIIAIAAGSAHSFALAADGSVYVWGNNNCGQLGLGHVGVQNTPQQILALKDKKIMAIVAGHLYSLALATDGSVYAWGRNDRGQLGLGPVGDQNTPQEILALKDKNIIALAAGGAGHSLALAADGSVYAWGAGSQLGLGPVRQQNTPQQILALNKTIIVIAAGLGHSLALAADGSVYAWGWNDSGQLGLGPVRHQHTPQQILDLKDKNIIAIAAGHNHSLALAADGCVYAWGNNRYGQLGLGAVGKQNTPQQILALKDKNILAIVAGYRHSLALAADGSVYAWGNNTYGQLGLGPFVFQYHTPVELPYKLPSTKQLRDRLLLLNYKKRSEEPIPWEVDPKNLILTRKDNPGGLSKPDLDWLKT